MHMTTCIVSHYNEKFHYVNIFFSKPNHEMDRGDCVGTMINTASLGG